MGSAALASHTDADARNDHRRWFALDRESWGLAALAIVPELAIVLIGERFRRAAAHLLETAAALERSAAGDSAVADAHVAAVLERGSSSSERARLVAALGVSVHVVLVVLLALAFDWTFVGG